MQHRPAMAMTRLHSPAKPPSRRYAGSSLVPPNLSLTDSVRLRGPKTATQLVRRVGAIAEHLATGAELDAVMADLQLSLSCFASAGLPSSTRPWRASYGRYPRILLNDPADAFQIILVLWPPGGRSAIHDHDDSVGGVIALAGELVETKYFARRTDATSVELRTSARRWLRPREFTPILAEDGLQLHDMANEGLGWGATLHVYLRAIVDYRVYAPTLEGAHREHQHAFWFDYENVLPDRRRRARRGRGPAPALRQRLGLRNQQGSLRPLRDRGPLRQ